MLSPPGEKDKIPLIAGRLIAPAGHIPALHEHGLATRCIRGALAGSLLQELALGGVFGQRRGALELGARLLGSAEFSQQVAAHGR
jgi:hypothetical protein